MPKRTSKVFVGSSSEAENVASHFSNKLRSVASVVFWKDAPEFRASSSTMDSLLNATERYDYGFFVFTPEDRYLSRGTEGSMGRDNVLFEFGLFLGSLGADRVFAVVQEGETEEAKLKIPTDLWGIKMPQFRKVKDTDLISEVDRATFQIREQIARLGPRPLKLYPITRWGFDPHTEEFTMTLDKEKLLDFKDELSDMRLCVVVRRQEPTINNDEDKNITVSIPRKLQRPLNSDMAFKVETAGKIQPVKPGDVVEGYLLLVPSNCEVEFAKTMGEMFDMGCELLEDVGRTVEEKRS